MKYEYYPKRRTEQERRELNEQILRLLQSEACEQAGVTDEDIFNRYTGDGGLHGLRRSDYENYNAFSAAKKELENGQFFTPPPLCEMVVSALRLSNTDLVADLTCGMGNFFNFLPNERNAYGCEVDPNACAVARKLYPQAHIVQGDIRDYEPQTHFDFVLGNPPFHLRWIMPDATIMTSHQYYCLKAAKLLKPLGILAVIVPASFLADSFSDKGAIRMMESRFSFLGQVMLPEHAFSDSGVDDFPTKLQFWQKKSTAADWTPKRYSTDCADIYIPSGHPVMAATALYEKFVMVAKADSTYESTTLGISISYPAALQDIMAIAEGESYEGFISGQLNPITCIYLYPAEDTTYSQDSIIAQIYWLLAEEKGPEASYGQCVTLATAKDGSRCICHLPMNVKLQYQTVENYNLDLWNIYNTIEQSLLNGEFTATLLGNN